MGAQEHPIRSSSSSARLETSSDKSIDSDRRRRHADFIEGRSANGTQHGYLIVADNSQSDDQGAVFGDAHWEVAVATLLAIAEKEALAAEDAAGGMKRFFHAVPSDPDDHPEEALTFEEALRHNASSVEEPERQVPSSWRLWAQQLQQQRRQEEEEQTYGTRRRRRLSEDEGDERREEKEPLECDDVKIAERARVCKEVDASGCVLPQLSWPQILKGEQAPLSVTGQGVSAENERGRSNFVERVL